MLAGLLMLFAAQSAPASDEITVTARRKRCNLSIAGRIVNDPEFRARAGQWRSGHPIRIRMASNARIQCLAKIMFRLADHGVTRAEFIDSHP